MTERALDGRFMQWLDLVLDLEPEARRAALESRGVPTADIDRVLTVLGDEDDGFLARTAVEGLGGVASGDPDDLPGFQNFTVLRSLGRGGMGQVLLARQNEPVDRLVAIKLIRAAWLDEEVAGRFRAEQQALARLNHPAIAQFYEAGMTTDRRPFVVMEYVDGHPLTAWCEEERAGLEQRLRLFVSICRGVEHAHRRLVLHRDLKPSNLLVESRQDGPIAKIIDFGIARSLQGRLTEEGPVTGTAVLGTPGYMSPEAFAGADLDTRTDVYSLGVVLYELLTGARPFEGQKSDPTGWIQRRTETPPRPGTRANRDVLDDARWSRRLQNDLDWITLRALAPERDQRYGSAAELADDLERALLDEPVNARPPGPFDRLARLVRRYRGTAAVSVVAIVLAALLSTISLWRTRQAEAQARNEAATSEQVIDFLVDLFEAARPTSNPQPSISVQELIALGAERLAQEDLPPQQRARLLHTLADVQLRLGEFASGRQLATEALELRERGLAADHPDVIASLELLGNLERRAGALDEASPRLERVLAAAKRSGDRHDVSNALNSLANLRWRQDRLDEAESLHREALEIRRSLDDPSATAASLNNLGVLLWSQDRFSEAEEVLREALASYESLLGADHPRVADTLGNLGLILFDQGRYDDAAANQERALATRERSLGPNHPETASALHNLALALGRLDRLTESEDAYRRALDIRLEALGASHRDTRATVRNLAALLRRNGRSGEADELVSRFPS